MTDHGDPRHPAIVRSAEDVQQAHDVLQLALDAAQAGRIRLPKETFSAVAGGVHTLCWLLGHPSETTSDVLIELQAMMDDAGLVIVQKGR